MLQLLLEDGFQNTLLLAKLCPMQEWPALAKTLLYIFSSEQREVTLLRTLNEWEIDKEGQFCVHTTSCVVFAGI